MSSNIYLALSKYNSATNENYLTESLVFLARLFLERVPEVGLGFANMLCGAKNEAIFCEAGDIQIATQVNTSAGRPDIEIRDGRSVVFVEVKHDSPVGVGQLERYKNELKRESAENGRLVLLTRSRYSKIDTSLKPNEYSRVYWYEIHKWLEHAIIGDDVCEYFSKSFIEFLEEKQMALKKVTPEYKLGVWALLNLTEMLRAAISEVVPGEKITNSGGWSWRGFYLLGDYWVGVRFAECVTITFENNKGYEPVTYKRDLNLEDADFFSLEGDKQYELLVEFLREAIDGVEISLSAG